MYKIVLVSWGGTRRDFMCGFATEQEATEMCEQYGWQYQQEESGYIWDLEVEEDEEDCDIPEQNDYDFLDYDSEQDCGIYDDVCDDF